MSMGNLTDKTARDDLAAVGRQVRRREAELRKALRGMLDEQLDVRVGAAAVLKKIAEEIGITVEELEQYAALLDESVASAPTPAMTPTAPTPEPPIPAEPTPPAAPAAPVVDTAPISPVQEPKAEAPKPKPDKVPWWDKPLQHIRRWKWLAWALAIVALLLSIPTNRWLDDFARWCLSQDTGAAVSSFTVIFKITWSLFWFWIGGWFGEMLERKLDTTSDT